MARRAAPRPSRRAAAIVRASEGAEGVAPTPPEALVASSTAAADPPPAAASAADSLPPERLKQLRRDGLEIKNVIKLGRRGVADGLALQIRQRWNTSEVCAGWLSPTPGGCVNSVGGCACGRACHVMLGAPTRTSTQRSPAQPNAQSCRRPCWLVLLQVARLYCHGKHAANMKLVAQQLEELTGGVVVQRAGGTVLLYRGDDWQQRRRLWRPSAAAAEAGEQAEGGQPGEQSQELAAQQPQG